MLIVMAQQDRRFELKVAPKIPHNGDFCAENKMNYYSVRLYVLAKTSTGSLTILEYIRVTHAILNDVKAYKVISYNDKVSLYKNFTDKAYVDSCGTKIYMPIKKENAEEIFGFVSATIFNYDITNS